MEIQELKREVIQLIKIFMEARLKSIEEKLDFIIEIFKVNPEFETFVKNALRNKEIERIKIEVPVKNKERMVRIREFALDIIKNKAVEVKFHEMGSFRIVSKFHPKPEALPSEVEFIRKLDGYVSSPSFNMQDFYFDEFMNDTSDCPLFHAKMIELFGEELTVEKCIEELDNKQ